MMSIFFLARKEVCSVDGDDDILLFLLAFYAQINGVKRLSEQQFQFVLARCF